MHILLEQPDFAYVLRGAGASSARVNERELTSSFIISPDTLIEDWPVTAVAELQPAHLDALLALEPDVVLLGSGQRQVFAPPDVRAVCLTRGIGIECMTNAAVARTYAVLAGEGRRVAAGIVLG